MLLMFGYVLASQDHFVLSINGQQQLITRADHPAVFIAAPLACFLGGLALTAGALYAHFGLKLSRPPSRGPWGFSWFGIVPFAIALLLILVAWLTSHSPH
jgi:hypothetical protein